MNRLFSLSACNMGLGLAHLRLTSPMRCSHFSQSVKFSAKDITLYRVGAFLLLKSLFAAEQSVQQLSYHIDREHEKCEQHRKEQLSRIQRRGAQYLSAEVDERHLYRTYSGHYQTECGIFGDAAEKSASVRAAIEAIEHRGEDEERKERGEQIDIVI